VYLVVRFLPKGPDSSAGTRGFRDELVVESA
jgi:SUZ-C motif